MPKALKMFEKQLYSLVPFFPSEFCRDDNLNPNLILICNDNLNSVLCPRCYLHIRYTRPSHLYEGFPQTVATKWAKILTAMRPTLVECLDSRVEVIIRAKGHEIWNMMFKKHIWLWWSGVHKILAIWCILYYGDVIWNVALSPCGRVIMSHIAHICKSPQDQAYSPIFSSCILNFSYPPTPF